MGYSLFILHGCVFVMCQPFLHQISDYCHAHEIEIYKNMTRLWTVCNVHGRVYISHINVVGGEHMTFL